MWGRSRWAVGTSKRLLVCCIALFLFAGHVEQAPAAAPLGQVTEFSSGLNPGSSPRGIALGRDGSLWFTDQGTPAIGRINPFTGQINEFSKGLNPGSNPVEIAPDEYGNMWFTDSGKNPAIGRVDSSGHITEFSGSFTKYSGLLGIARGPDGNMWFADAGSNNGTENAIGRINPLTAHVDQYVVSGEFSGDPGPFYVAAGSDGNVWFTDPANAPYIGRINPGDKHIDRFSLPSGSNPEQITAGPDRNLWFTDYYGAAIGRINPSSGKVSEFRLANNGSYPEGIATGPDGNMWFVDYTASAIGRINPSTAHIDEFGSFGHHQGPTSDIAAGPDGNMWFTVGYGAIGRIGTASAPKITKLKLKLNRKKHTAKFTFKAAGARRFQCALIKRKKGKHKPKAKFKKCKSPKTYKHLKRGRYTFEVRTVTSAGTGPIAKRSFKF